MSVLVSLVFKIIDHFLTVVKLIGINSFTVFPYIFSIWNNYYKIHFLLLILARWSFLFFLNNLIRCLVIIYLFKLRTYYLFYHLSFFYFIDIWSYFYTCLLLHRSSLIFVLFYSFKELQWFTMFNLLNYYWHFREMGSNICNQDCRFIYSSQFSLHLC